MIIFSYFNNLAPAPKLKVGLLFAPHELYCKTIDRTMLLKMKSFIKVDKNITNNNISKLCFPSPKMFVV